ncbi:MAG: acyl-CoA thioesterase [Anaerolineales bacterium]|jgi:acyl-CoA thioester hydrolase
MEGFKYFHPIEIRYGDLDPQGHVNNAKFFTYLEQARVSYIKNLALWDGRSFFKIGFVLADAQLTFKKEIQFGMAVRVGVRVISMRNKSMIMEYIIADQDGVQIFATGKTVLVTYDYQTAATIPIPENWRRAITDFEGLVL